MSRIKRLDEEAKKNVKTFSWDDVMKEIAPDYVEELSGIVPSEHLWRYDKEDDRFYFLKRDTGVIPFLSVTSFTGRSLPTSKHLIKWQSDNGFDVAQYKMNLAAEYGTLAHVWLLGILLTKQCNFAEIPYFILSNVSEIYKPSVGNWIRRLEKDSLGFLQFISDRKVEVIGVEFPVWSNIFGLAGCIDLIVQLDFNGSRVNSIVDLKSGRKGLYEGHELQLECYKRIWNEQWADVFNVTHIFNWKPNDWSKKPTYTLKNQTSNRFVNSCEARMSIARLEGWIKPPSDWQGISGVATVGEEFDYTNYLNQF